MVFYPEIKLRVMLSKVVLYRLIAEGVPIFVDSVAITMDLEAVVGEMDVVVHVF